MKTLSYYIAHIIFLSVLLPLPSLAENYTRYCNDRFGFCVDYPVSFGMKPAPANGDGRIFYDDNGFRLIASGINNVLDDTPENELKNREKDFDTITYRKQEKTWYVLSGYRGNDILYVKSLVGKHSINTLYLQYPTAMKGDYDATVNHIVKSFLPGNLSEPH